MNRDIHDINAIPGVRRIENFPKNDMSALCVDLTHAVYPHEQVYGQYCSLQEHIDCPPADVFRYLADVSMLAEWTYSLRGVQPAGEGAVVFTDRIGDVTKCYARAVAHEPSMTVDYHCAWDQGDKLWMIYLMRVVPAELVFDRPGSVVLWTNCHHPYYDDNPRPDLAPAGRKVWVGDLWPFFYAGHYIELQNLKWILEHRHANGLAIIPEQAGGEGA